MTDQKSPNHSAKVLKKTSGPRLSAGGFDELAGALERGSYGSFEAHSPIAGLLFPILQALGWRGNLRELFESLPHFADSLDISDLRNVLATLGFNSHLKAVGQIGEIDERLFPCIIIDDEEKPYVLLSSGADGITAFSGADSKQVILSGDVKPAKTYLIENPDRKSERAASKPQVDDNWFLTMIRRFDGAIWRLLFLTFFINLLALAVPLFTLSVYDQVIPIRAANILAGLAVGMVLVLVFDMALKLVRSRLIAFVGARIEHLVAVSTFQKILRLPASMTESAPLGDQVAKVRSFDSLRDIFTSVLVTIGLELPFVVIFLAVIGILALPLLVVPLIMIGIYAVIWFILAPKLRQTVKEASQVKARKHSFLVETISNMRTIREASVEDVWTDRYRDLSAGSALAHHSTAQISFLFQTLGQSVMYAAGLATLALGVNLAISGTLSVGELIASMALVWKVLSPIQNLFLTFARAEQIRVSVDQVNALMKIREEQGRAKQASGVIRAWQGGLKFNRVSLRYNNQSEPALLGVNFDVAPGEFLAVSGSNGSGKSSILRVFLGLQAPQGGQVTLDDVDIRQIAPPELRTAMSYVPQQTKLFHGTIAQNLRLGNPTARDSEMYEACELAGVLEDIEALQNGFETRVGDQSIWQMNSGLRQRLSLARAYIADAPVLLMDEPAHALDDKGDAVLMETLKKLKHNKTIVMVSHRPSHLKLADTLILLNQGTVSDIGAPDKVMAS
ncbi:peptidase domain-containing ABC transporter [Kordiimonas sp. SCSIO 12610]|uniref:peptidase domain-containing ABC transporter n=1 Tax=Kordiimonas sp. SCSIO 12610 TaxID=2829597 RepID=UPI0021093202|nr:peptidase domain-containing ABC transporter [Kordiimonas sp. SCSIO 12610]UTW55552.1 peptidase domain-containing ABC transporter [Kordiimonas sp. SCSIO 12610]